ncbi:MAG: hypothetical protein QM484_15710 [Woeseiaceae bacterium]
MIKFKLLLSVYLLGLSLNVYASQFGLLAYSLITKIETPIDRMPTDLSHITKRSSVPDLRGGYELVSFYVIYSNGTTFSSNDTPTSGIMSFTSSNSFQGMTFSGGSIIAAGTYSQTNDNITFYNMGVNFPTVVAYTWDGEYFTTRLFTSAFDETDVWKRVENLADDKSSTTAGKIGIVNKNLDIHIPSATYGDSNIWVDLEYKGVSGFDHLWRLKDYGAN